MKNKNLSLSIFLVCLGAFSFALYSQHYMDMLPCPWCILQRLVMLTMAGVALMYYFFEKKILIILNCIMSLMGLFFAGYQFWIASNSTSCFASPAQTFIDFIKIGDVWPRVFGVWAGCGDKSFLLGIDYAIVAMVFFTGLFVLNLFILLRKKA